MKKIQSLVQNFKAKKETQRKIPNQARRHLFYFVSHRVRIVKMSVKKASFFYLLLRLPPATNDGEARG